MGLIEGTTKLTEDRDYENVSKTGGNSVFVLDYFQRRINPHLLLWWVFAAAGRCVWDGVQCACSWRNMSAGRHQTVWAPIKLHGLDSIKRLLPLPSPLPPTRPPHGNRGRPFFAAAAMTEPRSLLILSRGGSRFVLSQPGGSEALKGRSSV